MTTDLVCRHCGRTVRSRSGLRGHERSCRLRPTDDELRQFYADGYSYSRLSRFIGVSIETAKRWYAEVGYKKTPAGSYMRTCVDILPLAGSEMAPLYAQRCGCEHCADLAECKRRQLMDLWPLCCIPTRREVAIAYRDGRIGLDGNAPEWLAGMLEEVNVCQ